MKIEIEFTTPDELVSRLRVMLDGLVQHSTDTVLVSGNFGAITPETFEATIERKDAELKTAYEQIELLNNHVSELKSDIDRLGFSNSALRKMSNKAAKWLFEIYGALIPDKPEQYDTEEHCRVLNLIARIKAHKESL